MTASVIQSRPTPRWDTAYASASRTASPTPVQFSTDAMDINAAVVVIDVTVGNASNVTFHVQGVDPLSGKVYELGTSTGLVTSAIVAASTTVFRIDAQIPNSATVAADVVPNQLLITPVHGGAGAITYTVSVLWDL